MADTRKVVESQAMSPETIWSIAGIVVTAGFSVWAINDARKQVKEQTAIQRNVAWARIVNDLMWDFVDPTDKAYSREVTKGLADFVLLSKALDPCKNPDALRRAATYEAVRMAEKAVADGAGSWKPNLDLEGVQKALADWKAQKDSAREQLSNAKPWHHLRRLLRLRTKSSRL